MVDFQCINHIPRIQWLGGKNPFGCIEQYTQMDDFQFHEPNGEAAKKPMCGFFLQNFNPAHSAHQPLSLRRWQPKGALSARPPKIRTKAVMSVRQFTRRWHVLGSSRHSGHEKCRGSEPRHCDYRLRPRGPTVCRYVVSAHFYCRLRSFGVPGAGCTTVATLLTT